MSQPHCASDCKRCPRELSRTSKTASCTSHKDKLGTNVAQRMLASVLQAASPELLKTKASEALVHLVSSRRPIRLSFIITSRASRERREAASINKKKEMLSLTLILLLAVEARRSRANNAPVCAIGLKKGARVRLPGGARRASPALQIRVRT